MHSILRRTSLAVALLFGVSQAFAAEDAQKERANESGKVTKVQTVHPLMGVDVHNQQNEALGELSDLAISADGHVCYGILGSGGVLGIGESYVAVPWKMLNLSTDGDTQIFRLNVSKADLDQAPKFTRDNWQELNNPEWLTKVDKHFKYEDSAKKAKEDGKEKATAMRLVRTSQIIGANVKNAEKTNIADINDLVFNDTRDHITFAIMGEGGFLEIGERSVAIPFRALSLLEMEDGLTVTLNMPAEKLQQAPVLKKENYADLTDQAFVENTRRFFNVNERGEVETESPAKKDKDQPRENQDQPRQENP